MKTNSPKLNDTTSCQNENAYKAPYSKKETTGLKVFIKHSGKHSFLIIIMMFLCIFNYAQYTKLLDVITLKDGTIIKGEIIENIINNYISLKTSDGQVKVVEYSNIIKLDKEKPIIDVNDYGGNVSIGVAIGGGGTIGLPIRYFLTSTIPVEVGVHLRPVIKDDDISLNVLFAGTFDFYFNKKIKKYKNRIQMNGVFINGGYHTGKQYHGTIVAIGWAYERFKLQHKSKSVSFELGVGFDFVKEKLPEYYSDRYYNSYYEPETTISPMLFWKIGWNFFIKKKG